MLNQNVLEQMAGIDTGADKEAVAPVSFEAMARTAWLEIQPKAPKPLIPGLQRDLQHGWLLPYLVSVDALTWRRWEYWCNCQMNEGQLPAAPIPQIAFCEHGKDTVHPRKMLDKCLNGITNGGNWIGWGTGTNLHYFCDWLLYGFGHSGNKELPEEPLGCEGASMRLYQLFDVSPLLLWPDDHFGDMIAETQYGKRQGFYPTPLHICEMMAQMTMVGKDCRAETICDPCVGTGRFLLAASNYSLRLYGQDIDGLLCKITLVNGFLYAPWLSKPIGWLDRVQAAIVENSGCENEAVRSAAMAAAEAISERQTEAAPPHLQMQLFDTEFDAEGTRQTAPILQRRKRKNAASDDEQLNLLD